MRASYDRLGLYHDAGDGRLIVPKRNPGFGWTVNVDHRFGPAVLAALGAAALLSILVGTAI